MSSADYSNLRTGWSLTAGTDRDIVALPAPLARHSSTRYAPMPARGQWSVYAVNYPATTDFANSMAAGANDASDHVQSAAANCPSTKMVLGGFSQGAAVVDTITQTRSPAVADHVAAVAVFGNPGARMRPRSSAAPHCQ